ncbi:hypothetical protein OESDEN_10769 [Oesophagostomum dentatum]|uniref:Uncharacterized protein n=1 Tax=Oesophagostomum dentatum TaxID=61180 RepID=A0A0B1SVR7_OESDE|nr:hypothetical protein OESDEN_10769 [Oesophagostomum dentatum]
MRRVPRSSDQAGAERRLRLIGPISEVLPPNAKWDFSRQLAHQTKHLKNTLNPEWAVFRVNMQMLCGGDRRRSVRSLLQ